MTSAWEKISPTVNPEAEFLEIVNDFGHPLEIVREAISNAIDANATELKIEFRVDDSEGTDRTVISFEDNGSGMDHQTLTGVFWGLGHSTSRGKPAKIGEKGHGTKIFLRSEGVHVRTQCATGAHEALCIRPLAALKKKGLHEPSVRAIEPFMDQPGTIIEVVGYNNNERSRFIQSIVKDYIIWATKIGAIEKVFGHNKLDGFRLLLKCVDVDAFETIPFGHPFPADNSDIEALFNKHGAEAAGKYVKRYVTRERLERFPEVTFDAIISVEGDDIKREYNPMIRERGRASTGTYRVSDRYGVWLCKDYIPVVRVNEWISGFGSGSNAITLLHGFVNCQSLKLTANRGTIANTDPAILAELQKQVEAIMQKIDADLNANGLYTLRGWQEEQRTLEQEKQEFTRRVKELKGRPVARYKDRVLFEPMSESEVFGLLMTIHSIHPELFDFEPLDYNTTRGIDLVVKDRRDVLEEHRLGYAELKWFLTPRFNHAFKYLKWIVCWDFAKNVTVDSYFSGAEEVDKRQLKNALDENKLPVYWLDAPKAANKIHVVRLKELLRLRLGLEFKEEQLFVQKH